MKWEETGEDPRRQADLEPMHMRITVVHSLRP